jgi:hypothetical protein
MIKLNYDYASNLNQHITHIRNIQPANFFLEQGRIHKDHENVIAMSTSFTVSTSISATQYQTFTSQGENSPVFVEEGKIRMNVRRMEIGKFYQTELSGKKYIINKKKNGIIQIFKVIE